MDYKSEIIKMIDNIENEKVLCFIHNLIISFRKKWGI